MISEKELCNITSHVLNDILLAEREVFRADYFEQKAVFLKKNGFDNRKLNTRMGSLNLRIPRIRENKIGVQEIGYSIFDKNIRSTKEIDNAVNNFYKQKNSKNFLKSLLKKSTITQDLKEKIVNEYLEKYEALKNKFYKDYKVLKMDSTYIKDKSGNKMSLYFLIGIKDYEIKKVNAYKKDEKKNYIKNKDGKCERYIREDIVFNKNVLYFYAFKGDECAEGWQKMIDFINSNIDTSSVDIIVSDMKRELKNMLHYNYSDILKQNCLFHRLESFFCRVDGYTYQERKVLFSSYYKRFKRVNTVNSFKEIIDELKSFKQKTRKTGKYRTKGHSDKMIDNYYDDNYSYLKVKDKNYKNLCMHNNDVEGFFSRLKDYLSRTVKDVTNEKYLIMRVMIYLENNNWLEK